jgi:hypothetical protein
VKILGKVEDLVCRILRVQRTVIKFGLTSTFERGKCCGNPPTVSVADTVNDDDPTKAIISSSCHNLRLPGGTEIFILLFAVPNSEPSAVPSSIPRAIPRIEPSLAPSADPISAPNELIIFFITCITFARHFNFLSTTVPILEPSLISASTVPSFLYQVLYKVMPLALFQVPFPIRNQV